MIKTVAQLQYDRITRLRAGNAAALFCMANRSKLRGLDFMVMHAIGRNAWNKGINVPVNTDKWTADAGYQAFVWNSAMRQMQAFYNTATKRKGIVL